MITYLTLTHNPTTITTPVYGVVGYSGTAWKVVNLSSVYLSDPIYGRGIYLQSGGTVINGGTGTKSASIGGANGGPRTIGVWIRYAAGTVTNFGAITGGVGVELERGGTVANFGTISSGAPDAGIVLGLGGTVTNALSASISGVQISGAAGTVTNLGVIGGIGAGDKPSTVTNYGRITNISLDAGGTITNATPKALISGGIDISRGTTGTVTNFGTIENGAYVYGGGVVTNGGIHNTGALISGYHGVRAFGATKLTNFGTITGVSLSGGTVTNGSAATRGALIASKTDDGVFIGGTTAAVTNFGTISGRRGLALEPTGASTVRNFGTISGHGNDSVLLNGTVVNGAGAVISGGSTGVDIGKGTVTNLGRISAANTGVDSGLGTLVTNGGPGSTSATISGGETGVVASTVKNFGTIIGAGGTAVGINDRSGRVIVEPGAKFLGASGKLGTVDGGFFGSTLELAAKSPGALLLGTQFVGFSTVIVDSGADWRVDVGLTSLTGETITGNGSNVLAFTTAGTFDLSAVRGFPTISLANKGPNALTLADANFTGVAGGVVTVNGGSGDDTIAAALAAKHHVVLHGGAGADIFELSPTTLATAKVDGGSGGDTLAPSAAGKLSVGGVSGVETYVLADGGANSLTLTKSNFAGEPGATITVVGGQSGNTVNASSLTAADRVVFVGGQGTDVFTGGAGNDVFEFARVSLAATDTVKGGAGNDELVLTTAATVPGGKISGVETFVLASDFANLLSLTNASFAGVTGNKITVLGGAKGNTFTADLGAGHNLVLDGGAGDDLFTLSPAALAGATVKGRAGSNTLMVTGSGTLSAAGMSGVETIELPFTAANTLTLTNANFAGVTGGMITVFGGNGGDTITANLRSGLSVVLNGGSGTNRFNLSTAALAASKVVGGQGADTLALTNPGTVAVTGVNGVETYRLADGGANSLTLTEANFGGLAQGAWITIQGGNAGNTINASTLESESPVILVGGLGKDIFTGGAGNDFFEFTAANLGAGDIVKGGTGSDELLMTTAGTVLAGGISGVETYALAAGGANSLTLTNASFAGVTTVSGVTGNTITVLGGGKGNTLTANLGTGLGVIFDGGAGNDRVTLSAATLAASTASIVSGGAGNDTLAVTGDGALSLRGVTGFETIALSGAATLSLADANFTDVTGAAITVDGGAKADTISAAGVSATNRVVMKGGAGGATLIAAQNAQMTGGAGADVFELTTPGNAFRPNQITIANFAHGTDKIAFSEFGFALGSTSVAATLFTANPTGSFTAPTQQFAYNTATGALYYDSRHGGSSQLLIATLSGHPTLAAGDITFVA